MKKRKILYYNTNNKKIGRAGWCALMVYVIAIVTGNYLLRAVATSTAQATVQPTIGLLPMPRKPIISTCAGTDDEPANCVSECIVDEFVDAILVDQSHHKDFLPV